MRIKKLAAALALACLTGAPVLPLPALPGLAVLSAPVEAAAAEVATPDAFVQALYENLLLRRTDFSITYDGNYEDIYDGDLNDLLKKAYAIHQSGSSDDFDYLQHNISFAQVNMPAISDQTEFVFNITYREPENWLQTVNQDVAAVLPSLRGSNDYETIRNVHDYVVNRITYDNSLTRYTAYQGIEEQSTVCQGYALLTYKLLTELGIPCRFVGGYAGESHAWNIVKLGNAWYFLDTTWDDPVGAAPQLTYDYFLIGSDKLSRDHTLDAEYCTPQFTSAYPISPTDYVPNGPETASVPEPSQPNAPAEVYRGIRQAIISDLDKTTADTAASPLERRMTDLSKQIIIGVLATQSDANLSRLVGNDALFESLFTQAYQKAEARIVRPMEAYASSDAYLQECGRRCDAVLARTDTAHMSAAMAEKFRNDLQARITEDVLMAEIERLSAAETPGLIEEISQDFTAALSGS